MRFNLHYKGKNNVWMTRSLFYDLWVNLVPTTRYSDPVFTFDSDRVFTTSAGKTVKLINFKKTFVELGDVTGYKWAMKYLNSWDHWQYLMRRDWFQEQYERAKDELHTKLRAEALANIAKIADTSENEAQKLAAAKYIAERKWEGNRAGRPRKAKETALIKEIDDIDKDAERMGLKVIDGGKVS